MLTIPLMFEDWNHYRIFLDEFVYRSEALISAKIFRFHTPANKASTVKHRLDYSIMSQ